MARKSKTDCFVSKEGEAEKASIVKTDQVKMDDKGINLNVNINLNFNILNEFDEQVDAHQSLSKPRRRSNSRQQSRSKKKAKASVSPAYGAELQESRPSEPPNNDPFLSHFSGSSQERGSLVLHGLTTQSATADNYLDAKDAIINLPGPAYGSGGGSFFNGRPGPEAPMSRKQTYFAEGKINYNKFELKSKKSQKAIQSNHTNQSIRC